MFRILIVEDIKSTLEELCELLREVFPDAQIEAASSVEAGLEKLSQAAERRTPFDVAILDFKMPARPGENPEINESLCQAVKSAMPDTLVIHITAFRDDEKVTAHVAEYHAGKNSPRVELIAKTPYWPEKLLAEMKAYLYGGQIEAALDQLFGGRALAPTGSLTHAVASLRREIEAHWKDLDAAVQTRVRSHFDIAETDAGVRVSLRPAH